MPRSALILVALLLLGSAPAFAQRPAAAQRNIAEAEADCRGAGGRPSLAPEFETVTEVNGDGQPDYVHAFDGLDCQGAATLFCGSAGCPVVLFLSPGYRAQPLGHVQGWSVDRTGSLPVLVLATHGSGCGRSGADGCEVRLAWNGREMARIGAGGRPPRVAAPAPAPNPAPAQPAPGPSGGTKSSAPAAGAAAAPPGQSWALRQIADGRQIALVAGPGVVQAVTVMCHQGVPVAALALRARPPEGPVTLTLAGRSGRASAPLTPGGGPVWVADLRNSAVARLLAGNDASLEVRINGGIQGRLPLQGSTRAVRDALSDCLRF
ncbi:hypothetical protein DFH01_13290 [Falsiroseomonas bella]|uniref:Uncharacterized protein n=1 Tax=Falsiroseomonas bella TaxID=2184016 RepID=A0A317FCM6_9PROT|nr:hypothetical protein [Falsiroseomonas bella]PWS36172.1 hypothetical protein DFH01_13290 [Falsiroseomonas bella]